MRTAGGRLEASTSATSDTFHFSSEGERVLGRGRFAEPQQPIVTVSAKFQKLDAAAFGSDLPPGPSGPPSPLVQIHRATPI